MTRPLILERRLTGPTPEPEPLPEHHYDPDLCLNVTGTGEWLIHAADPGPYTGTQEPKGYKKDD